MSSFSNILIVFLAASGAVYGVAVAPQSPPLIQAGDKGLSPFMQCAMALPGWPNANKDDVKKCAVDAHSAHKRDIIVDARYVPGDYTKCLEAIPGYPHNYDMREASICENSLPSPKDPPGTTLTPRDVGLLGTAGEYLSALCPVDPSPTINWKRFMTASTLKGWANTICTEVMGADTTNGNTKTKTDNKHGLRKIGITFAAGPQVSTFITLIDYGLGFFNVRETGVKYCVDAINAGIDNCVFKAKAGLEHADAMPSFTSYLTPAYNSPTSGGPVGVLETFLGLVDVSFPKGS